ncbi:unnamed protein product [Allacma fusca]|uniref:Uncharacterized protein n=1 Tax=Allacma fusca TaxID=39272 RepID=A0A8J2PRY4_9HEXA|nr:unnamed protein product [Allacma fusca]
MALSIKFCIATIFCCAVAFSRADYYEDQYQSTFELSHTIDPDVNVTYRNWTSQKWFQFLQERDVLIREDCEKCDSLFKNDMNTLFVARKNEIIETFSPKKDDLKNSKAAWSNKPFQTYTLLSHNGSVFHCGLQYFYAQVDEQGLPTDLLGLSDSIDRLNASNLNSRINCYNIDESNAGPATVPDELDGEDLDVLEDIPEDDVEDDIPEEDFIEDISDYYLNEDVPEKDSGEQSLDDDFPEETSEIEFSEELEPDAEENESDETRVKRQLQLHPRRKYYRKNFRLVPRHLTKTVKPYSRYVRSVEATYDDVNEFSENSEDDALENADQEIVDADKDVIGVQRQGKIQKCGHRFIRCKKTRKARIPENEFTEENSEQDIDETSRDDVAGNNLADSENDEIEDFGDIEDDGVDTRVKRQLQLSEIRPKIYEKFPIRQYSRLHKRPKGEHLQSDTIDDEDDSIRVRRQIRIPHQKLTFPKSSEYNKYPFPNGFRNPILKKEHFEKDFSDEIAEDNYAEGNSEIIK